MKLPINLSRSASNSPNSSTPPSPSSSPSSISPTSTQKKPRFPLLNLGRSRSKKQDLPSEIVELSSPKPSTSPPTRLSTPRKAVVSTASPSHSARHSKAKALEDPSSRHGRATASEMSMHEIKQVFAQFDVNGDGKISSEELRVVLTSLGDETTSEEAEMMVREVDADGDGYIDLKEFVDLNTQCLRDAVAEEEMAAAFAIFDLDKNGRITADELQQVLSRLGGAASASTSNHASSFEDCKRMIRGVDRKGAGHVDFDDFKRMMTPLTF